MYGYRFIRYRSPSRRRETAWGAEGLRGNEANENKLMVLVLGRQRKRQSTALFTQEDMTLTFGTRFGATAAA